MDFDGARIRVTVHPGEDVLLPVGMRIGEARGALAKLLQRPELRNAPLWADGYSPVEQVRVTDDCIVGDRPLLPGAILRVGHERGKAAEARGQLHPPALSKLIPPAATASSQPGSATSWLGLLATALPVLAFVGLAAALRQPMFALFSAVGLLGVIPQAVSVSRERRSRCRARRWPAVDPRRVAQAVYGALAATEAEWSQALRHVAEPLPNPVPDAAVAFCGSQSTARAAARALVLEVAARGADVTVIGEGRRAWAWCRWLPGSIAGARSTIPDVLVADLPSRTHLDFARDALRAGANVVLCLSAGASTPTWCRDVRVVSGLRPAASDGSPSLDEKEAERLARLLAAASGLGREVGTLWRPKPSGGTDQSFLRGNGEQLVGSDPANPRLPSVVPLADLLTDDSGCLTWAVPLGVDTAGQMVRFDLVRDGPHLLVAGTTGSGKSELLQALVLGLALRHSPRELALALIDFKGGASFGDCLRLPHVLGRVSDLDATLAARALTGLRVELRRRKTILAQHGVADSAELPDGVLPRLVVVVDEFRALADDLPDLLPGLLRIAAQGRSLGIHLVLATQRPAGAISADMRANITARLALRVVDTADSLDVLDSPVAAHIPHGFPGRAVLRVGVATPVAMQCAYAGAPATGRKATIYRAPTWREMSRDAPVQTPPPDATGPQASSDPVAELANLVRQAAVAQTASQWPPVWLPPLPDTISLNDVDALTDEQPAWSALPLALGDLPNEQSRTAIAWQPTDGHLAILGQARTGATTALVALAHSALARGWHVHALVPKAAAPAFSRLRPHPGFGTLAGPDDLRRTGRLLRLLIAGASGASPTLVLIDGIEDLRAELATPAVDPVAAALAAGTAVFAVTSRSGAVGGLAARFGPRLTLLSADAAADVLLGVPGASAGRGRQPGRGVWLGASSSIECQIALPGSAIPAVGAGADGSAAPIRLLPLPNRVTPADLTNDALPSPLNPLIGIGGDMATPLALDVSGGALIVGARGSGRTTTLRILLRALGNCVEGDRLIVIGHDPALLADAAIVGAAQVRPTAAEMTELLGSLARLPWANADLPLLLIDDADALASVCPIEADQLAALAATGRAIFILTASILDASLAHRGLLSQLRGSRTGVILSGQERGAEEVFGVNLADAVEPGLALPGRAALIAKGRAEAIQLVGAL
ncbi:MAG: FtsK/SpoIIIE domain-containing protein [Promicromonosporaceae bacterium]|nr:FtsK/SpoIIIE domain-containing protein [Promicromonosporaceae bacterium]